MKRLVLLAVAAAVIPACGGTGGDGLPDFSAPAPIVLQSDTWSTGPSPQWGILAPTAVYDPNVGNPGGSMFMSAYGGAPAEVISAVRTSSGTSVTRFTTSADLTIAVDVKQAAGTVSSVDIMDGGTFAVVAMAYFNNTGAVFTINGTSKTVLFTADGAWHRYAYMVRMGVGFWTRDGVTQFAGTNPSSTVCVHLSDGYCGTWFDNVLITVP
ncbi:MAG TPA: hypothetical protein VKU80_07395 [Planctomycetota bacterium]|nr:hypothetical protein [Planctomycetota bacterium]